MAQQICQAYAPSRVAAARQDLPFSAHPGQRLVAADQGLGYDPGPGPSQDEGVLGRLDQLRRAGGGVQVVLEGPVQGRALVIAAVDRVGLLRGVIVQQVVQGVPVACTFGQQARAGQFA
jgi:hypothetical protein